MFAFRNPGSVFFSCLFLKASLINKKHKRDNRKKKHLSMEKKSCQGLKKWSKRKKA